MSIPIIGDIAKLFEVLDFKDGMIVLLVLIILYMSWSHVRSFNKIIDSRQDEINRIASENKDYRDRFTKMIDNKLGENKNDS